MRTDQLVDALVADTATRPPPLTRRIVLAALLGLTVSIGVFAVVLGPRADLAAAFGSWRFLLKLALISIALLLAVLDCVRAARPETESLASRASLLVPLLIFASIALELLVTPANSWERSLVGSNALVCLTAIPLLSLAPLAALLIAMREGAASVAARAGAATGRLAAALAALLYALHCFDDSPLFVATWYTLATLLVVGLGALAGHRVLRW